MHAVLGCWIPITHHYALPILPTTSQGNTPNISSGKRHFIDTLITAVKTQKRLITRNTKQIYFKIGDQAILRMKTIQYAKFGPSSRGNLCTNLPTPSIQKLWSQFMATPFMSRHGKQKIISQSILTTAYVMLPKKKIRNILVWVLGEGPRDLIQKLY